MVSKDILSTLRTDGNGTRFISTTSREKMKHLLLNLAADKTVQRVAVELEDKKAGSVIQKEFIRHINPPNIRGWAGESEIGGLVETTAGTWVPEDAYVSSISVIMDNVVVRNGSVVTGSTVHEGNKVIDNRAFYEDAARERVEAQQREREREALRELQRTN